VLATNLIDHADRHGFEVWALWGAALQATVNGLASIGGQEIGPNVLAARLEQMTARVKAVRDAGLTIYIALFDGALGQLLTATAQLDQAARAQLDTGLATARATGMSFYDAELLRLRAHTQTELAARQADIDAALELARRQGATLFELRAALDDFGFRGEPGRAALADAAGRIPADSALPELARARAALDQRTPKIERASTDL
jgi:hypothetical protein